MQILILTLKLISIPLIIIVGEAKLNEKNKTIILLLLAFLYNNLLGCISWLLIFLISMLHSTYFFIVFLVIIGVIFLTYLITINIYIKRKIDVNTTFYVILSIVAFLTGIFLI